MGRGRIEIRRIENAQNRHVTFTKRKNGIVKKATELSILCQVDVALIVFSSSGKCSDFCSAPLTRILEKFQKSADQKLWDVKHEDLNGEIERVKKENEKMQMELRHLKGEDLQSLEIPHLHQIEHLLEKGFAKVRDRELEVHKELGGNINNLEEENRKLNYILKQQQVMMNFRDIQLQCMQKGNEFAGHLPFTSRVQPIQPNLHKDK